jgi:hypothetical protein
MESIYKTLIRKAEEINNLRESDCKNMEIQQFIFDIDGWLKDGEISQSECDVLFDLV